MHSSNAFDVLFLNRIYAMNGKSVEVDNTDAEGRLVLSGQYMPSPLPPMSVPVQDMVAEHSHC